MVESDMCYFLNSEVLQVHDLPEDKPIYGYKLMRLFGGGTYPAPSKYTFSKPKFRSKIMNDEWEDGRLSAKRPPHPGKRAVAGIYAYGKRESAYTYSDVAVVVKVALWGRVIEHDDAKGKNAFAKRGYRAQHAKIVAVYLECSESRKRHLKAAAKVAAPGARIYTRVVK
jgi:hypothetical protein